MREWEDLEYQQVILLDPPPTAGNMNRLFAGWDDLQTDGVDDLSAVHG